MKLIMLTKYGTDNIIVMLAAGALLILLAIYLNKLPLTIPIGIVGFLLIIFTFWFFRDPDRTIPAEALSDEKVVISPSDGKIVEVVVEEEPHFLKSSSKRISIFLSPLDVHVNRMPIGGVVKYFQYLPGDYLVAYHPKSSLKNEQTHIGVENASGKLFFKQLVGILARRLVWDIKQGDSVEVGQKFGMMKFGSRIDIAFPLNTKVLVDVGDVVIGGETKIAELP